MPSTLAFTKKTFAYFEAAARHKDDIAWFASHRKSYIEQVELPMTHLTMELKRALSPRLPGVEFSTRRISRPVLRSKAAAAAPLLRTKVKAFFSETPTSMFESNPGIYLSFGATEEDTVIGFGIYMPSSRQTKSLRPVFYIEHEQLDQLLSARPLLKHWKGLTGERYRRFPKEYDEHAPGAEFLWYKHFFMARHLSREEVCRPRFFNSVVAGFEAAVPLLTWTRRVVGVYRPPPRV